MNFFAGATTLWRREMTRFLRQPSRIVGAAGSPLLFWILIGSGFSGAFRLPGTESLVDYRSYFFPGTIVLVVLFSAIFSTLSIIEDRQSGFLQGVLVAPTGRGALVGGKVLGGATIAWLQGVVLMALAPVAGLSISWPQFLAAAGVLALLAIALTALGFIFAWRVSSTQGFHAVMNLLLVPLWLLSGSLFPLGGGPRWLELMMRLNPLTYGVAWFRRLLAGDAAGNLPSISTSAGVVTLATVLVLITATVTARYDAKRS